MSEKKTGYYNYLISLFYLKGHERYPKCNAICFDFVFKYTENYYIIQIDVSTVCLTKDVNTS